MKVLAVMTAALVLSVVPSAQADRVTAPPGNSGVDQYFETVPSATGNRPPGASGSANHAGPGVSARTQSRLARLGKDGRAAAALAQQTAPGPLARSHPPTSSGAGGGSPFDAILHAVGGDQSGGMGFLLPAILIGSALLGGGFAMLRRRQRA